MYFGHLTTWQELLIPQCKEGGISLRVFKEVKKYDVLNSTFVISTTLIKSKRLILPVPGTAWAQSKNKWVGKWDKEKERNYMASYLSKQQKQN